MANSVKTSFDKMVKLVSEYFDVKMKNDFFNEPLYSGNKVRNSELVYEYSYNDQKIGYLYFALRENDQYVSFEFDKKYYFALKPLIDNAGFKLEDVRSSFPHYKLEFLSFEKTEKLLMEMCKTIRSILD